MRPEDALKPAVEAADKLYRWLHLRARFPRNGKARLLYDSERDAARLITVFVRNHVPTLLKIRRKGITRGTELMGQGLNVTEWESVLGQENKTTNPAVINVTDLVETADRLPDLLAGLALIINPQNARKTDSALLADEATVKPDTWQHSAQRLASLLRQIADCEYTPSDVQRDASTPIARLLDEIETILERMMNGQGTGHVGLFATTHVLRHRLQKYDPTHPPDDLASAWEGLVAGTWPDAPPPRATERGIVVDEDTASVRWGGKRLTINEGKEFGCFIELFDNHNHLTSYYVLCVNVLNRPVRDGAARIAAEALRAEISRIRRACEEIGCPCKIENRIGKGYILWYPPDLAATVHRIGVQDQPESKPSVRS